MQQIVVTGCPVKEKEAREAESCLDGAKPEHSPEQQTTVYQPLLGISRPAFQRSGFRRLGAERQCRQNIRAEVDSQNLHDR